MTREPHITRFDTTPRASQRQGIKTCALIARKLETIYDLPAESSHEIEDLLRKIDRKFGR